MRFSFNEKKAAQAAAFLLRRHGGQFNYMHLIKLLYLADRAALVERGLPITGDTMVSMPKGQVLSGVLDLVTHGTEDPDSPWYRVISGPIGVDVSLVDEAGVGDLSEYEIEVLSEIDDEFGSMNRWDLIHLMHEFPEWEDPQGSSRPIRPETILRESGVSDEEIRHLTEEAEALRAFDSLKSCR